MMKQSLGHRAEQCAQIRTAIANIRVQRIVCAFEVHRSLREDVTEARRRAQRQKLRRCLAAIAQAEPIRLSEQPTNNPVNAGALSDRTVA